MLLTLLVRDITNMRTKVLSKHTVIIGCLATAAAVVILAWQHPFIFMSASTDRMKSVNTFIDILQSKLNYSHVPMNQTTGKISIKFSGEALNQSPNVDITETFRNALTKYADPKKNIAISLVDFGYLDMAVNLYLSYQMVNLNNYLFVSSDSRACKALAREVSNPHCVQYVYDADAANSSAYGSTAFFRKTNRKTKIVLDALLFQFNVLLVDLDIFIFKNPFPFLDQCSDCDLQVEWDHGAACSGFYFVRSAKAGIQLMATSWIDTLKDQEGLTDQGALNGAMKTMKHTGYYKQKILPEEIFPNGFAYFHDNHIMFATDGPYPPDVYIVHDNWIRTEAAKIYRFKENLMWLNDKDGYYSDPTRKYLSYSNALLDTDDVQQLEMDALKAALVIGQVLNRTVILPTFSCKGCDSGRFGACKVKTGRCSFHTRYEMETFDKALGTSYREHVFLMNPLVPRSVVQSTSPTVLIQSDLNNKYSTTKTGTREEVVTRVTPINSVKGANVHELETWFAQYTNVSVLVFDTLYGAVDNGIANSIHKTATEKIESAFKKVVYIQ